MPPWWHFGFRLESKAAVRQKYAEFQPLGCVAERIEEEGEGKLISFRVRDLDGYLIEIYWEPASTAPL